MTPCIHSAIAPNMNRCIVCGKVWTGERWEAAASEEPTTAPSGAKLNICAVMVRDATDAEKHRIANQHAFPLVDRLKCRSESDQARTAVAALIARNAELEAERVAERNEWQLQMTDVESENKALREAFQKARNSAAGYSNYCDDDANTRRCERELDEAERMFRAIPART